MAWTRCGGSGSSGRSGCRGIRAPGQARDFSRWVQAGGKPESTRWARSADSPAARKAAAAFVAAPRPNRVTGKAAPGPTYAPATAVHGESVLRAFYDLHIDTGQGPMVNPFPLARERRPGRAGAHRSPMEPPRNQRVGLYRPKLARRPPRYTCRHAREGRDNATITQSYRGRLRLRPQLGSPVVRPRARPPPTRRREARGRTDGRSRTVIVKVNAPRAYARRARTCRSRSRSRSQPASG
jgi:hypothetical protein